MIVLGADAARKRATIDEALHREGLERLVVLSPERFHFPYDPPEGVAAEWVEWDDIIEYRFFYRLVQEIDNHTLVVVNEGLRTRNRYDLTYNCVRHFLNQTRHQIIFQYFPLIEDREDFMILFDFDTRSRWKREPFRSELLGEAQIYCEPVPVRLLRVDVPTPDRTRRAYEKKRADLFASLGLRDPHILPRHLHQVAGRDKARFFAEAPLLAGPASRWLVGRNNRLKLPGLRTYRDGAFPEGPAHGGPGYTIFEFCHARGRFADFLSLSGQTELPVLVADLKVEHWYFERYARWEATLHDAYAALPRAVLPR